MESAGVVQMRDFETFLKQVESARSRHDRVTILGDFNPNKDKRNDSNFNLKTFADRFQDKINELNMEVIDMGYTYIGRRKVKTGVETVRSALDLLIT